MIDRNELKVTVGITPTRTSELVVIKHNDIEIMMSLENYEKLINELDAERRWQMFQEMQ